MSSAERFFASCKNKILCGRAAQASKFSQVKNSARPSQPVSTSYFKQRREKRTTCNGKVTSCMAKYSRPGGVPKRCHPQCFPSSHQAQPAQGKSAAWNRETPLSKYRNDQASFSASVCLFSAIAGSKKPNAVALVFVFAAKQPAPRHQYHRHRHQHQHQHRHQQQKEYQQQQIDRSSDVGCRRYITCTWRVRIPVALAAGHGLRGPAGPAPIARVLASLAVTSSFFFFDKTSFRDCACVTWRIHERFFQPAEYKQNL